jgi:hypothetical protein
MCRLVGNAIEGAGASDILAAVAECYSVMERVDLSACGIVQVAIPPTLCPSEGHGVEVILRDNPIVSPPPEVVARGWEAIRLFTIEVNNASMPCNRVKLLLVGDSSAGKSSIVAAVKAVVDRPSASRLVVELPEAGDDGRTMGVEQCTFPMSSSPPGDRNLTVTMVDVAGQHESYPTHVFFMSHRSVVALVVDISWHAVEEASRLQRSIRLVRPPCATLCSSTT